MHRGLSFVSTVAVVGLLLNASVVGFAQDQPQQEDSSIDDDSDALDDDLDDSASSGDSDLSEEPPATKAEDEQESQTPSEVEESQSSELDAEQESEELKETGLENIASELSETKVQAQEDEAATTGEIALELGSYFRSDNSADTYAFAPILSLWVEITDALDLVLEAGCVYAGQSDEEGKNPNHFYLGNPYLGIRRAYRAERTHFHFGFGFTVPISSMEMSSTGTPTDPFEETTYRIASAMRGRWSYWLWMPEHVALVIPIGARMVSEDNILFGGELGLAVIAPTGDYHDHRGDFIAQGAGELGFGFETVETGLRLQAVLIPLITNEDKFQSAIGPFVKVILDGGHVGANVMVNLDEDEGVFGEADRWGLNLKGGIDF
jgi:hypothetical protein